MDKTERWTYRSLWSLVWPLIIEQLLLVTIGLVDTAMIATVGEAAVSGVALVDAINILLIAAFSSLATGGAVVVSQYIGRKEPEHACQAARQLMYAITAVSLLFTILTLVFQRQLLQFIYGHIGTDVMKNAETYLWLSAVSYPFIAIYNAGAALFRSIGNSKISMITSLLVNIVNIGGNALLIYGLGWGVAGAATASLVSRVIAAIVVVVLLLSPTSYGITLAGLFRVRLIPSMIKSILKIGVPNGLENSMFQIGKLLVSSIISTFGTFAIAGNAVANLLCTFIYIVGLAIAMALVTVVGQCVGAKDYAGAKKNTHRLLLASHGIMILMSILIFVLMQPLLSLFNLSPEAITIVEECTIMYCVFAGVIWPTSFVLPSALRAAGDARFSLLISMLSMWIFRIGFSYLLAFGFGLQVLGVWIAMIIDWVVRAIAFWIRWKSGKWQSIQVIQDA